MTRHGRRCGPEAAVLRPRPGPWIQALHPVPNIDEASAMSRIQSMGSTANRSAAEPIERRVLGSRLLRAACLALLLLGPGTARADLTFAIEGVQGPTGGVGSFEVSLTNTSGGTAVDVAGFSFELS